jgi:hypothetical protein
VTEEDASDSPIAEKLEGNACRYVPSVQTHEEIPSPCYRAQQYETEIQKWIIGSYPDAEGSELQDSFAPRTVDIASLGQFDQIADALTADANRDWPESHRR